MSVKLQENLKNGSTQFTLTLPKNIAVERRLKKGDEFEWIEHAGYLALKPVR